jgi:hypothetical protein
LGLSSNYSRTTGIIQSHATGQPSPCFHRRAHLLTHRQEKDAPPVLGSLPGAHNVTLEACSQTQCPNSQYETNELGNIPNPYPWNTLHVPLKTAQNIDDNVQYLIKTIQQAAWNSTPPAHVPYTNEHMRPAD